MADELVKRTKKGKRAINWSEEETNLLVELVSSSAQLLASKFGPSVRHADREAFWAATTEQINAVGGKERTKVQVCKKWQDLKRFAKKTEVKKRKNLTKTGGGKMDTQTYSGIHEKIIGTIPSCCLEGIGGEDTSKFLAEKKDINADRTAEEIYFAQAIENTIAMTTSEDACNVEENLNEVSVMGMGDSEQDEARFTGSKENKFESGKKRTRKGTDDMSELIIKLETEHLEELKKINKNLEMINKNLVNLIHLKQNEVTDQNIVELFKL